MRLSNSHFLMRCLTFMVIILAFCGPVASASTWFCPNGIACPFDCPMTHAAIPATLMDAMPCCARKHANAADCAKVTAACELKFNPAPLWGPLSPPAVPGLSAPTPLPALQAAVALPPPDISSVATDDPPSKYETFLVHSRGARAPPV